MMIHRRLLALTTGVHGWLASLIIPGLLITATFVGQGALTVHIIGLIFAGESWQATALPMLAILAPVIIRTALRWFEGIGAKMMAAAIKERLRTRLYAQARRLIERTTRCRTIIARGDRFAAEVG